MRQRKLSGIHSAEEVGLHQLPDYVQVGILKQGPHRNAGVIQQYIQAAKSGNGFLYCPARVFFVAYISAHGVVLNALVLQLSAGFPQAGFITARDNYFGAGLAEHLGTGAADT
jgi:hypothetical protein